MKILFEKTLFEKIINKDNLTEEEMINFMRDVMNGNISDIQLAGVLTALRAKGECLDEIVGGAKVMREMAKKVYLDDLFTLDTCGTGGDGAHTFNISTLTSIICAAAGISVVKHGNRSVSSKCGSADVLEALGVNLSLTPEKVELCVRKVGIGFFFAQNFHPAMKHAANVRKNLGIKTIFNLLGPLTNPANARAQVLGVYDEALTETFAEVLRRLGTERALVVHGLDGLDEITLTTETKVTELKDGTLKNYYLNPKDFGFSKCSTKDLVGGSPEENAGIILDILKGKKGPKRDVTLLNCGAALYAANKVSSIKDGIILAEELIDNGSAMNKLNEFISFTNSKPLEI